MNSCQVCTWIVQRCHLARRRAPITGIIIKPIFSSRAPFDHHLCVREWFSGRLPSWPPSHSPAGAAGARQASGWDGASPSAYMFPDAAAAPSVGVDAGAGVLVCFQAASDALSSLGHVYTSIGDYPNALASHKQCVLLARQSQCQLSEARQLGNMGAVYTALGDFTNAVQCHEQHLSIAKVQHDSHTVIKYGG